MNYTSIFKGTIRSHEWRDYAAHMANRVRELAPAGTLKVHSFDMRQARTGCIGAISYEPKPQRVTSPTFRMALQIARTDPFQHP